jgi:hypothetical protein
LAQWRYTDTHVQRAYAAIGLCRGRTAVMSASDRRTRCNFRGWPRGQWPQTPAILIATAPFHVLQFGAGIYRAEWRIR